jgi:hypothetical protein
VLGALVVLAGLATGALLLFGGRTLDTAEAERQIARITEEQAGVAPTQVSCPEDVPLEAGTTTRCTAQLDGQPISFTVRQTDDEGNVRVDSDSSFVIVAAVEQSLTQQVGDAAGVPVTATCDTGGRTVLVDGAGTPIPCTVTNTGDATDTLDVVATVDDQGAVSYQPAG